MINHAYWYHRNYHPLFMTSSRSECLIVSHKSCVQGWEIDSPKKGTGPLLFHMTFPSGSLQSSTQARLIFSNVTLQTWTSTFKAIKMSPSPLCSKVLVDWSRPLHNSLVQCNWAAPQNNDVYGVMDIHSWWWWLRRCRCFWCRFSIPWWHGLLLHAVKVGSLRDTITWSLKRVLWIHVNRRIKHRLWSCWKHVDRRNWRNKGMVRVGGTGM